MNRFVIGLSVFFFLFYLAVLLVKYYVMGYNDWDLAFFSQASWNLLHGQQFVSLVGINYFGDHGYFITFLILPFFFFFPSPVTLLVLKALALVVAAWLLYRLTAEELGEKWGAVFFTLYLIFPANIFGLLYEFNPDALAPPIIFWIYATFKKRQLIPFMITTAMLMMIKENLCLAAFIFSLLAIFRFGKVERRALALYAVFCLLLFFYISVIFVPGLRGLGHHSFTVRYPGLGNSTLEVILSPILNPSGVIQTLFNPWNKEYLSQLFGYTLLPALLSPLTMLPTIPLFLQHLMSSHAPEKTIYYHYGLVLMPFVFMAMAATLKRFYFLSSPQRRISSLMMILLLMLGVSNTFFYEQKLWRAWRVESIKDAADRWELVRAVPPTEGVVATFRFLAPLSTRKQLYSLHMIYDDLFQDPVRMQQSELYTGVPFRLPDSVNYVLLDLEDRWLNITLEKQSKALARINAFIYEPSWRLIRRQGNAFLFKRNPKPD